MRGHLFQSADEETEARGGPAPCPRSQSELVSVPAQGPASCHLPHSPRPCPSPAASSPCPCAALPCCPCTLPSPLCTALMPPCLCLLQGPLHRHPCAGPKAPSACGTRLWQARNGGSSAPGSRWGEALSHSAPGTPPGSDSDSAIRAHWDHSAPLAKVRDEGPCSLAPNSLWSHRLLGGGGALCLPTSLPTSVLAPVAQQLPCAPSGPGVGWDGSVETLAEHEADAVREGKWGLCPALGSGSAPSSSHSLDSEPVLRARRRAGRGTAGAILV